MTSWPRLKHLGRYISVEHASWPVKTRKTQVHITHLEQLELLLKQDHLVSALEDVEEVPVRCSSDVEARSHVDTALEAVRGICQLVLHCEAEFRGRVQIELDVDFDRVIECFDSEADL